MSRDTDNEDGEGAPTPAEIGKDRISDALKQVYDDIASEPLPDTLSDLLEKLKNGSQK